MPQDMTRGRILPIILKFTIPLVIGNIFQQFYNMADTIIVGRFLGASALAAVGATSTVSFLMLGFAMGLATGFSVLTSQQFGAGDEDGVKGSVANGILLALLFSALLTAAGLKAVPVLLSLMHTPPDIAADATAYMLVICSGLTASMFYNLFSSFLRSVGNSRAPFFFLAFSSCLNIVLDIWFIVYIGAGVRGAACATVVSQVVSVLLCALYILLRVRVLIPSARHWGLNRSATVHQLRMGIPMALQFAVTAAGTIVMQTAINMFGSVAVAAFTAAWRIQNVLTQGMVAMGQTMAAFCGQNFGSKNIERVRQGVRTAVRIEIIYSAAAGIAAVVLLPWFLRLFFSGSAGIGDLMPWAMIYTVESALFFIPLSLIFIFRNAMQGCSYSFLPLMGGVVEMAARTLCALAGIRLHSYLLSAGCDAAAWITAGTFLLLSYRYMLMKLTAKDAS